MAASLLTRLSSYLPELNEAITKFESFKETEDELLMESFVGEAFSLAQEVSSYYCELQGINFGDTLLHSMILETLDEVLLFLHNTTIVFIDRLQALCNEQRYRKPGRPKIIIDDEQIASLRSIGMSWIQIADILGVSYRTLYRHRKSSPSTFHKYSEVSDQMLDQSVLSILHESPNSGERMVIGSLLSKNVKVQRWRVRKAIERVNPYPKIKKRRIRRRVYNVPCSNALWHQDGNHKLIRWRFVIHGCIDGFSRLITFLKCSNNNRASTVLEYFIEAVETFRLPMRIRTDHGTENVDVARYLLSVHGVNRKPVITGKSVHNQRIERLWVDVFVYVLQQYYNIFYHLEDEYDCDPGNDIHMFALHYVYTARIQHSLCQFQASWNNHPMRTTRNRTPLQVWTEGFYNTPDLIMMTEQERMYFGIDEDGPNPVIQTANHVVIPEIDIELPDGVMEHLLHNIDPMLNDNNFGITTYSTVLSYLQQNIVS